MMNQADLEQDNTLFTIQEIETTTGKVSSMFDSCSECNLILNSYDQKNRMLGYPISVTIDTIKGKEDHNTNYYQVFLYVESKHDQLIIIAFSVDRITPPLPKVNPSSVKDHFPQHVQYI